MLFCQNGVEKILNEGVPIITTRFFRNKMYVVMTCDFSCNGLLWNLYMFVMFPLLLLIKGANNSGGHCILHFEASSVDQISRKRRKSRAGEEHQSFTTC